MVQIPPDTAKDLKKVARTGPGCQIVNSPAAEPKYFNLRPFTGATSRFFTRKINFSCTLYQKRLTNLPDCQPSPSRQLPLGIRA